MDLKEFQEIASYHLFYLEKMGKYLRAIKEELKNHNFTYVKVGTCVPFITDAPDAVLIDIPENYKYRTEEELEQYIEEQGYHAIWDENLTAWFGENELNKYIKEY